MYQLIQPLPDMLKQCACVSCAIQLTHSLPIVGPCMMSAHQQPAHSCAFHHFWLGMAAGLQCKPSVAAFTVVWVGT